MCYMSDPDRQVTDPNPQHCPFSFDGRKVTEASRARGLTTNSSQLVVSTWIRFLISMKATVSSSSI
jgi:hypothetical protein